MSSDASNLDVAIQAHLAGDWVQAARLYTSVIESDPQHVTALFQFGHLCHQVGKHRDAVDLIGKAIELADRREAMEYRASLVAALLAEGRAAEALAACEMARAEGEPTAALLRQQSSAFLALGEPAAAIDCLIEATRRFPDDATAWEALAERYGELGRWNEAAVCDAQVLELAPQHGPAIVRLTAMMFAEQVAIDNPWLDRIRTSLPFAENPETRIRLRFALAQAYDQRNEVDSAQAIYRQANQELSQELTIQGRAFRLDWFSDLAERVTDFFTSRRIQAISLAARPAPRPVFVLGLPCSGVDSLIQTALREPSSQLAPTTIEAPFHKSLLPDAVRFPEDFAGWASAEWSDLAARLAERLQPHGVAAGQMVCTNPLHILDVGLIAALLPGARFVTPQRDEQAILQDCYRQPLLSSPLAHACCDLERLSELQHTYAGLLNHWSQLLPSKRWQLVAVAG